MGLGHRSGSRLVIAIALAVVAAACAERPGPASAAPPMPSPSQVSSEPKLASATEGSFQLTFELPRTTFGANELIQGRATLAAIGGYPIAFGSSGNGPFV